MVQIFPNPANRHNPVNPDSDIVLSLQTTDNSDLQGFQNLEGLRFPKYCYSQSYADVLIGTSTHQHINTSVEMIIKHVHRLMKLYDE